MVMVIVTKSFILKHYSTSECTVCDFTFYFVCFVSVYYVSNLIESKLLHIKAL